MLTVACVMRSGGDFSTEWVERLEKSCFENIREAHRFICLTDITTPGSLVIDYQRLQHSWPGWWSKIELFRPGLFLPGEPILFFDLDTLIVRNIEHLQGAIDCDLILLRDFYRQDQGWGTGVMGWTAGDFAQIYELFKADARTYMSRYRSDQDFIRTIIPPASVRFWQDEFPRHLVSYKVHCQQDLPGDAHVVCFHGKPRPGEAGGWVQERWGK